MSYKKTISRAIIFASVTAGLQCHSDNVVASRIWTARIVGTVRDQSGTPIANASVVILPLLVDDSGDLKYDRCSGSRGTQSTTHSATNGRFEASFSGEGHPSLVCLLAQASAAVPGGVATGTTEADSVLLGPTGVDSVDVSVVVRKP
jgi:hypothetical protein